MTNTTTATHEALYEQVASKIEHLISRQILRCGDKMPSVRKVSREQGVSLSTVFQAYYLLENKGFIEARPRSGYYVRQALQKAPPEPSMSKTGNAPKKVNVDSRFSDLMKDVPERKIVDFSVASPSADLLPVAKLNKAVTQALRVHKKKNYEYIFPPGNPRLIRQIALHSFDWGGNLDTEEIIITNGCIEALNICLRAVANAGDTIVIESPTYYGLLQVIESLGMKALEVATNPVTGVCLDELEKAISKTKVAACLFVLNFNNPIGSCMPDEKKEKLVKLLRKKGVPLIEDDLYGDLYFGKKRPRNAKAFDKDGMVLLCSSFSKTVAPGFRIGWVAPGKFRDKVERIKYMSSVATPSLIQEAMAAFLETGRFEHHLKSLRLAYQVQVRKYTEAICNYFPSTTRISRPEGGFVLWIEIPGLNAAELQQRLLTQGINIMPGNIFTAQDRYRHCIRISCGMPWNSHIDEALQTVGKAAKDLLK